MCLEMILNFFSQFQYLLSKECFIIKALLGVYHDGKFT